MHGIFYKKIFPSIILITTAAVTTIGGRGSKALERYEKALKKRSDFKTNFGTRNEIHHISVRSQKDQHVMDFPAIQR